MDDVEQIELWVLGRRRYPHTCVRLPEHLVSDLPELLDGAQALNPVVDADALLRTIFRLGCQQLRRNNERGVPVRAADLKHARRQKDQEASRDGAKPLADNISGLRPSRF
jgi:hypothetical protein